MSCVRKSCMGREKIALLSAIAVALSVTGCGPNGDTARTSEACENTQSVQQDAPPLSADAHAGAECAQHDAQHAPASAAPPRGMAVPAGAVDTYEHLLSDLSTQRVQQLTLAAMLDVARSSMPYEDARQLAWDFARACSEFSDAECVLSTLWSRAKTLDERHEAMVVLGFAAAWHGAAARGIPYLNLIITEQTARAEPSARHITGAYQNLATLYSIEREWKESVRAAQQAIAWWEREKPEQRTCSRAGLEATLVEALANAGHYAEAEQRLLALMKSASVDCASYAEMLTTIRFYRGTPSARNWSRPAIPRRY